MITKHDDLLGTLIHDVAHALRLDIDQRLAKHNLTRVKWLAIGIIHKSGPLTQAQLAAEMELGNASVGRLVDRLEERGFVTRSADPNDRRSYLLTETDKAQTLLEDLKDLTDHLEQHALKGLSKEQTGQLTRMLQTIKANLKRTVLSLIVGLTAVFHKVSEPVGTLLSTTTPL